MNVLKAFWTEGFPAEQRGFGGFTLVPLMIELQMVLLSVLIRLRMELFFFQDVHTANSTIVRVECSLPRLKRLHAVLPKLYVILLCHIVCGSHCVGLVLRQVGQSWQAGQIGAARSGHGI